MKICLVYDCLFPHTVGGAERWYRDLAERLAADGHDVVYLTLRQWPRGERARIDPRVRVATAGPRMALYTEGGRRRILPPLVFGLGVLWHLARHGRRYDVVHTCSFPYFPLLAAALVRPLRGYGLVVDWFEVWSREYWRDYLGGAAGLVGLAVQRLCASVPQRAFCFSELHASRLQGEGLRGSRTILRGLYAGSSAPTVPIAPEPLVVFAGRLIPEKRAPLGVAAVALAAQRVQALLAEGPRAEGSQAERSQAEGSQAKGSQAEGLRAVFYGEGPELGALREEIRRHGLQQIVSAPGFAAADVLERDMRRALCILLPSRREGYGLVVVEAAARATPSVVVAGPDNAAVELVQEGVNGFVASEDTAEAIAEAIVEVWRRGLALRESTAQWFADNAATLSLESSLQAVLDSYDSGAVRR
jgi:glycosyltransferase involved in cell wall biosynthesis